MLEILLLAWLCTSIGKILRGKGRKPLVFQILLVISWFAGEVFGFIVGGVVHAIRHGDRPIDGFDWTLYLFALGGAAGATAFWFTVVALIPPKQPDYASDKFAGPQGPSPVYQPPADPNNPYAPPRAHD